MRNENGVKFRICYFFKRLQQEHHKNEIFYNNSSFLILHCGYRVDVNAEPNQHLSIGEAEYSHSWN